MDLDVDRLHRSKSTRLRIPKLVYQAVNNFDQGEIVMKNNCRLCAYLTIVLMTLLLSACFKASYKNSETADTAMLMDKSANPAPHALIRMQERPVFQIDDKKRPFAMIDDRIDKIRTSDKPITIRELKPK
jgi:hypothetical protein